MAPKMPVKPVVVKAQPKPTPAKVGPKTTKGGSKGSKGSGLAAAKDKAFEKAKPSLEEKGGDDHAGRYEASDTLEDVVESEEDTLPLGCAAGSESGCTAAGSDAGGSNSTAGTPHGKARSVATTTAETAVKVPAKRSRTASHDGKKPKTDGLAPLRDADSFNHVHYGKVQNALQQMLANPVFENIRTEEPLQIDAVAAEYERGDSAHFNMSDFMTTMTAGGSYRAGCNFMWLDIFRVCAKGVPFNEGQVRRLKDHFFKDPRGTISLF